MKPGVKFFILFSLLVVIGTESTGLAESHPPFDPQTPIQTNIPSAVDGRKRGDWLPLGTSWSDADPAVAYSTQANQYLVVFSTYVDPTREIRGVFVDAKTGSKLGNGFVIADGENWKGYPDAAYDSINNRFLVVWEEEACTAGFPPNCAIVIKGRLIHSSYQNILSQFAGSTFTAASQISTVSFDLHDPAVAFNTDDGQYALVFNQKASNETNYSDIYGRLLSAHTSSPTPLGDAAGFLVWDYTTSFSTDLDIAWSNSTSGTFFAVWMNWSESSTDTNISAAYIYDTYQGGAAQIPGAYLIAPKNSGDYPLTESRCYSPSVAYNTNSGAFVVVFEYAASTQIQTQDNLNAISSSGIYGQQITPNYDAGTFRFDDQYAFPIETDQDLGYIYSDPAIANSAAEQEDMLVTYIAWDFDPSGPDFEFLYARSLVGDTTLPRFLIRTGPEDDQLWGPALACQYSECLVTWVDSWNELSNWWDVLGQLIGPRDEILFDEAHDEQNTLSWERAQEIVISQGGGLPEWYYYGDLEDALLGEYHFFVNEDAALTYENIDGYAALVLSVPREALSSAEVYALQKYVAGGGGLVLIGDCGFDADGIYLGLHDSFGISFTPQCLYSPKGTLNGDLKVSGFDVHPAVEGVSEFNLNWGQSLDFSGAAELLAWSDNTVWQDTNQNDQYDEGVDLFGQNFPVVVGTDTGCGRVVAIADNSFQDDGFDFRANDIIMRALLNWVTAGTSCEVEKDNTLFLPLLLK